MKKVMVPQALCGAVIGLLAGCILAAVSAPSFSHIPMTWTQVQALERFTRLGALLAGVGRWGAPLALAALSCSWVLMARGLNKHLPPFPFRGPRPGLAWTVVLLSACALATAVWSWQESGMIHFGSMNEPSDAGRRLAVLFSAACSALAWLILAPSGWASDLSSWRKPAAAFGPGWGGTAALGAVFGGALCLGSGAVDRLFGFLFSLNVEVWNQSVEVNFAAFLTNIVILIVLGAVAFALAGGLAAVLAPDEASVAERASRARSVLALLLLAAAAVVVLHRRAVSLHQWRAGGLAEAAELPDRVPAVMTMVTMGFEKVPLVSAKDWPLAALCAGWVTSGKVAATAANADALRTFLEGSGKTSRFRGEALDALPTIDAVLWEPARSFSTQRDLTGGSNIMSFLGIMMERGWLANSAPITPENLARLTELSDEAKYRLPQRQAMNLAKAWLRFGDLERARRWQKASEKPSELVIPAQAPLADGRVRGRFSIKGKNPAGARVGLFRVNDLEKSVGAVSPGRGALVRLVGSKMIGADGAFEFSHVAQGRYALSVLVPKEALASTRGVSASLHPGILTVDRAHPRLELGTINLAARSLERRK